MYYLVNDFRKLELFVFVNKVREILRQGRFNGNVFLYFQNFSVEFSLQQVFNECLIDKRSQRKIYGNLCGNSLLDLDIYTDYNSCGNVSIFLGRVEI